MRVSTVFAHIIFACIALTTSAYKNIYEENPSLQSTSQSGNIAAIRTKDVNKYVDYVLAEVSKDITANGLDPYSLPNIKEEFFYKPLFINYTGLLELTDGWLQGLSTVKRYHNVTVYRQENTLTLDIPLIFRDLFLHYKYSTKIMGIGPNGRVEGQIGNVKANVWVNVDLKKKKIALNKISIADAGQYDVKFSGNFLVDWFTNILLNIATNVFKILTNHVLSHILHAGFESAIEIASEIIQYNETNNAGSFVTKMDFDDL